jgi:hypothetical protein
VSESAASAIRRFVEELADLRRAAGSPSLRDTARSSPNHKLAHSTAGDALKGDRLPSLQVVLMVVRACQEYARRHHIAVNDEDFDRTEWQHRWGEAKKLSQGLTGRPDEDVAKSLAAMLAKQGDVEGLRQRADAGDEFAAKSLAAMLAKQGDVEGLRRRADAGDWYAAKSLTALLAKRADAGDETAARQLADLLADRGDVNGLSRRADAGDEFADEKLSELLAEGGDVERLLRRTEVGSKASSKRLADVLFRRGDVESLRHRADASDTYARALLVLLLAKQGDVESLNQLVDVGDPFAAAQLAGLPGPGGGEVDRGEHLEPELVLADEPGPAQSDRGIEDRQIELLFERGDVEGLRQRAKAGNHFAYALLAVLFAELEGLRQRADAGDEFAAKSLEALADAGDEFAAKSLAAMLAERNHVEGAVRRVISASSGSHTSPT